MKIVILFFLFAVIGCQTQIKKDPSRETDRPTAVKPKEGTPTTTNPQGSPAQPAPVPDEKDDGRPAVDDNAGPDEVEPDVKPRPVPRLPKVGVIFGPGGGRTFGHIGVLQEIQKNKIPIYNVAGMEFGSLIAGIYAWHGSANDVEWQMFKIKSDDILKKNLISGKKAGEFDIIQNVIKSVFHNLKAEDLRKQFACPALNLDKQKLFVMNRGNMEALLPYCVPYPPLFKPYQKNIAGIREVKSLADHLRRQGANYIVFINVLGGNPNKAQVGDSESTDALVWSEISSLLVKESAHVDYTITLNLDSHGVLDFENKRDMMLKGAQQSNRAVKDLAEKLGL